MCLVFFFFKQKTAYEMRISDWSSDVCSSDLHRRPCPADAGDGRALLCGEPGLGRRGDGGRHRLGGAAGALPAVAAHLSDVPRRALLRQQSLYLERAGGTAAARALAEGRAAAQATLAGRRRVRSAAAARLDRKSVVEGKSVSVRGDLGGRRIIKKK